MRLLVNHTTSYHYDAPVDYNLLQVRLTPKECPGQKILSWTMMVEGGTKELVFKDQHANAVDLVSINPGGEKLTVHCQGEVEITGTDGVVGPHRGIMALWNFCRETPLTTAGEKVTALVNELGDGFDNDIAKAHALSAVIVQRLPYLVGKTRADTSAEDAISSKGGVCQDHAHIFITVMRTLGFPARYVSGYLMMNDHIDQDATHAWAEAWFENIGWVGFDVSNGYSPDERYIRVATGLDYRDAAPVCGVRFGPARENMIVQLQVQQ